MHHSRGALIGGAISDYRVNGYVVGLLSTANFVAQTWPETQIVQDGFFHKSIGF